MSWRLSGPEYEERIRQFVQIGAGVGAPVGPTQVMGFLDEEDGRILGAWMFERYTGRGGSVYAHWASSERGWLNRTMLNLVAIYVFDQLGCNIVLGEVRATDTYTRRVNEKLGFVEVATIEGYFPDGDLVLYSLRKDRCRWLPADFKEDHDGQEKQAAEGA